MPADRVKHAVGNPGLSTSRLEQVPPAMVGGHASVRDDLPCELRHAVLDAVPRAPYLALLVGCEEQMAIRGGRDEIREAQFDEVGMSA